MEDDRWTLRLSAAAGSSPQTISKPRRKENDDQEGLLLVLRRAPEAGGLTTFGKVAGRRSGAVWIAISSHGHPRLTRIHGDGGNESVG